MVLPQTNALKARLANDGEADDFLQQLQRRCTAARLAIAKAQEKQMRSYNKGRKQPVGFEVGAYVLVNPHSLEWKESKGAGAKLVQRWIGPFEIIEKVNEKVFRLRMDSRYPGSPVFNIDHLRKYVSSPAEFGERTVLEDTRAGDEADEEYEVEGLVGHRWNKSKRGYEFLVRWRGYSAQHDKWCSSKELKNASEMLKEYKRVARDPKLGGF